MLDYLIYYSLDLFLKILVRHICRPKQTITKLHLLFARNLPEMVIHISSLILDTI